MIAILQYNAGNATSVKNAVERLGYVCRLAGNAEELVRADKVIFPGVGEAGSAMSYLRERGLDRVITGLKQPVLGICLGLQLLCRHTEEGNTSCMGIFNTIVRRFPPNDIVPHVGWNTLRDTRSPLFTGHNEEEPLYFVHSYYAGISEQSIAICDYIAPFSAAMQKGNFYATQFHPEKSGSTGERILANFLEL